MPSLLTGRSDVLSTVPLPGDRLAFTLVCQRAGNKLEVFAYCSLREATDRYFLLGTSYVVKQIQQQDLHGVRLIRTSTIVRAYVEVDGKSIILD